MEFVIRTADTPIRIRAQHEDVRRLCEGYILPEGREEPRFTVEASPRDIGRERECAAKMYKGAAFSDGYLETLAVYRAVAQGMLRYDTLLMHGSVVASGGRGYMICAPSGVGKSTRTRLWIDNVPGSFVVNGDKPLLRVGEDAVTAYGTPWCGKEGWNRNTGVPLRAIFLLERGENEIREVSFAEELPFLLRQTFRPAGADARRAVLRLVEGMEGKVRLFRFSSLPDGDSVHLALRAADAPGSPQRSRT